MTVLAAVFYLTPRDTDRLTLAEFWLFIAAAEHADQAHRNHHEGKKGS